MIKGIDLSFNQTTTPPLTGFDFVIAKASQEDFTDPMWVSHSAATRNAGLLLLAYHYGKPASVTPIAIQVARFLSTARLADYLFLDQEGAMSDADAMAFLNLIRKSRECGLYHSSSGFGGTGGGDAQWVADYRDPTGTFPHKATFADGEFPGWDIWQYTDVGKVAGYAGNLDLDYMNPKSPLVARLRVGYVDPAPLQKIIDGLDSDLGQAGDMVQALRSKLAASDTIVTEQASAITALSAALDAAPGIERERIASAEKARVLAL